MYEIKYRQFNVRELELESKLLIDLDETNYTIGFEITHRLLGKNLDLNIDPQHKKTNITKQTCVEKLMELLPIIKKNIINKKIWLFFLKTDLDSIAAAATLELYLNNTSISEPIVQKRIFNIANYDRHGRKWNPKFNQKNKYKTEETKQIKYKIPRGLFMLISGWKNTLEYKIQTMKEWILTGTFQDIEKYNKMAIVNFKESLNNSKIEIIIPNKLVLVKSNKRGACGIGYQFAPIVIAMNPSFRFGFGDNRVYGRKWVVAQCDDGFITMSDVLRNMLEMEYGWGGSNTIIGSPQDSPSRITKEDMISAVTEVVEKSFQAPKKHIK